jgi:hypothetical protein
MRTRLRSKTTLLFMTCAVILALPAMALADTLQINNTLVVGSNVSKDPGQSGTGKVWLDPSDNSTDPQNGCNATNPAPVTVSFTSSDTSKIANPDPITLTECGPNAAKDFSYNVAPSATAGTVQISGAVSGGRGGTYNTNDTLTVTINAPAKQNTSISNVSGSGTYGGTSTLTAKLSSGANNLSGKNVAFELNGQAVGTDATDANGVAELSGVSLSGINAGTYNNAVSANFVGDSAYDGSSGSGNLSVAKANPTIDVKGYTGVYDGNAHGATGTAKGVNDEDLSNLLDLGSKFTDVPGGTAHWTFSGDTNYKDAEGDVNINITKADATIDVKGYTGTYDGDAHGATGTATGVKDEDLSGLLNLGDSFTNVPGGTANWSFAGNGNYNSDSGTAQIVINQATPQITWSNPAAIDYGTALSATQLNATVKGVDNNVLPGNSVYTPAAGTVLKAGPQTLTVNFTPADSGNYSEASKSVTIVVNPYSFTGFFQPIDNGGVLNSAKAGSTIPVKFSLGGDKGMDILAQAPTVGPIKCDPTAATDPLEEVSTATVSGLKYDPTANQYIYNWKTSTSYAGTCQQLVVRLADGTTVKSANFKFAK